MNSHKSLSLIASLLIGLSSIGCKKQGSRVKSLENFALGKDVRINACSAPADQLESKDPRNKVAVFVDVNDANLAKRMSSELILALSAVPDAAFRIFQAKNGKVLVTPDANRICNFNGAVKFNGVTPVASSCLVYTPFGTTSGKFQKAMEGSTLVIVPDATAIRHGVVRSMGYMLADALAKDTGFSVLRAELTKAFLSDMASSTVFSLKTHEGLLGPGIDEIVRKNIAKNEPNLLEGAKTDGPKVHNFMQLVIGEAFDSYYCRVGGTATFPKDVAERIKAPKDAPLFNYLTDTRLVMSYFFPRTFSVFKLVEAHMEGFAAKLPAVQFRNGRSSGESSGGFSLAEDGGQSVGARITELEAMVRQNATLTREAHEQFQQKKEAYDGSWSDVWGTKKSEMDTAKATLRYAQGREQALIRELEEVRAEEKRIGSSGQTSSQGSFQAPDLKVGTFDFNAELAKGVQDTAKQYGENTGAVLGKVGGAVAGETGKAFGEGLGDGVGGVLGAFGKNTTDGIAGFGQKITDTQKFATDLAVDPAGTMMKQGQEYVDGTIKRLESVQTFGNELISLDTDALAKRADGFVSNTTGIGTLYNTGKNVYSYATATTPEAQQAAIQAQYQTAGNSISDVQSALVKQAKKELAGSSYVKPVVDTVNAPGEYLNHQVHGMIVNGVKPFVSSESDSSFSALKKAAGAVKFAEQGWERANTVIDAIDDNKLPTSALAAATASVSNWGKPESSPPKVPTFQPTVTPLDAGNLNDSSPFPAKQYSYSPSFAQPTSSGSLSSYSSSGSSSGSSDADAHIQFWEGRN